MGVQNGCPKMGVQNGCPKWVKKLEKKSSKKSSKKSLKIIIKKYKLGGKSYNGTELGTIQLKLV
jgi:hypothetical protein